MKKMILYLRMVRMISVGEVHAGDVHACIYKLGEHFDGLGLGTNGANKLRVNGTARRRKGAFLFEVDGQIVLEGSTGASPAQTRVQSISIAEAKVT